MMTSKVSTPLSLSLLLVLFFALVLLNNQLLSPFRLDLTENQVYSLSQGSKDILKEIDEPINLYFFFSDKASRGMTTLRNYASRVQSLLEEYANVSEGKVHLQIIDPEPFSENEDKANEFGLTAATIGQSGDAIYLGLAASNSLDDQQTIAFFDPQQESFLEYEISKLLHKLTNTKPVKVTLLTDLNLQGGQNPMTGRFDPPWVFYQQLQQLYQVETLGSDASDIPADTDVLMLVHPQNLSEAMLYSIDQFAMTGGKILAFLDPHNESDSMAMMSGMGANSSNLDRLFSSWGIEFNHQQVVLDAQAGLDIRTQAGGVARHMGFLGLGAQQLDRSDVTTAGLEVINGASFGVLGKAAGSQLSWTPLMQSSEHADLLDVQTYVATQDATKLADLFSDQHKRYVLAARVSGKANSAFNQVPEGIDATQQVRQTSKLNVIVVADTDLLSDRFWVQQSSFFGQTIMTPFANNGDFITNSVENLGGSNALISIRSRGTFARPFNKVDALTVAAEQKFREQEQLLQQQLDDTEQQLSQLQNQQGEGSNLVLTPDQQQAVEQFMHKRIEIRKALRDVRHQLDKDIEELGNWLKFINIAVAPLLLVMLLSLLMRLTRSKSKMLKGHG